MIEAVERGTPKMLIGCGSLKREMGELESASSKDDDEPVSAMIESGQEKAL
jgi:hypothetical protein